MTATPLGKTALIDGDILVYECGFGAESAWRYMEKEDIPPFSIAQELVDNRIEHILRETEASSYKMFLTGTDNFRFEIATTQPYKNRKGNKPFHYANLRAYLQGAHNGIIINGYEADDALSLEQWPIYQEETTIICSRDKDLRMVPGLHFGWEMNNQPSFGPRFLTEEEGYRNFFSQCLTGDSVDTIPGLPRYGPVKASKVLENANTYEEMLEAVREAYNEYCGGQEEGDNYLLEQGRLLWMVRELDEEGSPVMWRF